MNKNNIKDYSRKISESMWTLEKLMKDGLMGGENDIAKYEKGGAPWCITYTFMPNELEGLLLDFIKEA